jgi:hypothetical protein
MTEPDPRRAWHLRQLARCLQSLAAADGSQAPLFPGWAKSPADLAFDFDHWASVVRSNYDEELTGDQRRALAALEAAFAAMSRESADFDLDIWTEPALATDPRWAEVRRLAGAALEVMGSAASGSPEAE